MPGENCLHCGAYLHAKNRAVAGVDLCVACVAERPAPVGAGLGMIAPPRATLRGSVPVIAKPALALAALGAVIGSFGILPGDGRLESAAFLGGAGLVLGGLFGGAQVERASLRRHVPVWRDSILEQHRVSGLDPATLGLAVWKSWPSDSISERDIGVLVEAETGFLFLGKRGTRALVDLADVRSSAVVRDFESFFPYTWVLRLDLGDGSHRSIEALHAPHRAWATGALERIRVRRERKA